MSFCIENIQAFNFNNVYLNKTSVAQMSEETIFDNNELEEAFEHNSSNPFGREEKEEGFFDKIFSFFKKLFNPKEKEIIKNSDGTSYIITKEDDDIIQIYHQKVKNLMGSSGSYTKFKAYSDESYDINGELDKEIEQGYMEDCGLLGVCYSFAQNNEGAKILKEAISANYDEKGNIRGYEVYFKGLDETYTISNEELSEAYNKTKEYLIKKSKYSYSRGDKDMLLLELAWSKCWAESEKLKNLSLTNNVVRTINSDLPSGLSNVNQAKLFYALCGGEYIENPAGENEAKEYLRRAQSDKTKNIEEFFVSGKEFKLSDLIGEVKQGYKLVKNKQTVVEININDAYQVINSDKENIVIKNLNTNEIYTGLKNDLIGSLANLKTKKEYEFIFDFSYDIAQNADIRTLGTMNDGFILSDIENNEYQMHPNHCYAIKDMTQDFIVLVNPYEMAKEIKISKEELKKYCDNFRLNWGEMSD